MEIEEIEIRTTPVVDGEVLPMQTREFQVTEFKKLPKRARRLKADKVVANIERRKKKAGAADSTGPEDDPEEEEEDDPEEEGADEDRFAISISSEHPVSRWGITEILDHSPGSVDMTRAKLGLSFLDSHGTRDIVGIVNDVSLGKDKVLRGVVQFSRNAKAQDVKRDVVDGIRKFISVGYSVAEYTLEKSSSSEGDTYRATKWTPMEASSVAVPADPSVGHNRKAGERGFPVHVRSLEPAAAKPAVPSTEESRMATATETSNAQAITDARGVAAEIMNLGKRHGIEHERVATWVKEGRSVDAVSALVLEEVAARKAKPTSTGTASEISDEIVLNAKEDKEYNLGRGILAMANAMRPDGERVEPENCLEIEISRTIEKNHRGETHGGLFMPWSLKTMGKRAGLDSATATTGAELKFTEPGAFIDFLYNRMRVKELGAVTVSGLRDNVAYPKQTGKASGSWVGENPGTDVADSNLTLGQIASSPKIYQSSSSYSRQLLAQAVVDVDGLVRADLARDMALALDLAAITGATGGNNPVGIMHTSGVQSFVLAADSGNGAQPTYDDIVHIIEDLEDVNADQLGDPGWLTTPGVKALLKLTARLANTIALPVWADNDTVSGFTARSSNQVPKVQVRGSTSNNHALILGVFAMMVIGMWGSGFELIVDPYRLKKQGMIELTTFMLTDVTLKYPQAFVVAECQK